MSSPIIEVGGQPTPAERTKHLATVATLECGDIVSTYLLSATVTYRVPVDRRRVQILCYDGRGTLLDGSDRGDVQFTNASRWEAEVTMDRSFSASGELVWSDAQVQASRVSICMRATLLENDDLAYVTTTITSTAAGNDLGLYVQMPAAW
jgi:hypothetical protein